MLEQLFRIWCQIGIIGINVINLQAVLVNELNATTAVTDRRCQKCPVRHHAICAALGHHRSGALSDMMVHRHYQRGQQIWGDQDEADFYAIVITGAVKLIKFLEDGREQIVGILFPADSLGSVFSELHQTYAEAVTGTELCCFPRKMFERAMSEHPELEHAMLKRALEDLDHARNWMLALGQKNAMEKVASFLVEMARRSDHSECHYERPTPNHPTFILPINRREIAGYLGLTVETVSRNFTKLKAGGVIRISDWRTIEVCDPERLEAIAAD